MRLLAFFLLAVLIPTPARAQNPRSAREIRFQSDAVLRAREQVTCNRRILADFIENQETPNSLLTETQRAWNRAMMQQLVDALEQAVRQLRILIADQARPGSSDFFPVVDPEARPKSVPLYKGDSES